MNTIKKQNGTQKRRRVVKITGTTICVLLVNLFPLTLLNEVLEIYVVEAVIVPTFVLMAIFFLPEKMKLWFVSFVFIVFLSPISIAIIGTRNPAEIWTISCWYLNYLLFFTIYSLLGLLLKLVVKYIVIRYREKREKPSISQGKTEVN